MQKINASRFKPAEHVRASWQVNAEPGMSPDDLAEPNAWGNVAYLLNPFDTVVVLGSEGDWWAECLVWDTNRLWARVEVLRASTRKEGLAAPEDRSAEFRVIHRGVRKWSVIQKEGNAVIKDGFQTRDEAEGYLAAHLKAQAA